MRSRPGIRVALVLGLLSGVDADSCPGSDLTAEQRDFFEKRVRPVLADHCQKCHNEDRSKGGLRLDALDPMLEGGDSGPAIVPGKPDESLLIEAVRHDGLAMPPSGTLPESAVADLTRWVEMGAPWPGTAGTRPRAAAASKSRITDEDRNFWSFRPIGEPAVPRLVEDEWSRNDVDRFILAKLQQEGLAPAPEADRPTLIRRLTLDLTGLPPTPEEVDAFVHDRASDAYERLVDRLLESPRYGERWGRHWLDLVRYAESDGHRQDAYRPQVWRYRDYVVDAFNRDVPYDRFLTEQLAGDELDPDDPTMRVATAYYRHGPYEFNQRNATGQWSDILNEVTDVTAEVFLGVSLACARCHDHKFDPILQEDYFRFQAFFTPLRHRDDLEVATPAELADYRVRCAAADLLAADVREELAKIERPYRLAAARDAVSKFPEEIQALLGRTPGSLSPYETQIFELSFRQVKEEWDKVGDKVKGPEKARYDALRKRLAELESLRPPMPGRAFTVTDVGPESPPTTIPGDRSGRTIEPGYLAVLGSEPAAIDSIAPGARTTGRRLALARWISRPDNPLSNRVIVNRIWQYHFGRGLVATSSDLGRLGEAPSHPELLDWLARRFVAQGRSFKAMHRLLLTSATYRQSALTPEADRARVVDPENRWLWRANRRRLEAEEIRDAALAVSGELDPACGGPSVDAARPRRALYMKVVRNSRDELMDAFDAPDGFLSTAQRNRTTTPTQALLLINSPWVIKRARAMAERLIREVPDDEAGQVARAYRLALGREASRSETVEAASFLSQQRAEAGGTIGALADFCHALLNTNEFLHVD